jgi:hypothetical protein
MDAAPDPPLDAGRERPDDARDEPLLDEAPPGGALPDVAPPEAALPEAGALLDPRLPLGRALSALFRPARELLGRSEPGRAMAPGGDAGAGATGADIDGAGVDPAGVDSGGDTAAAEGAGRTEPTGAGYAEPIGATSRRMRSNNSSPLAISGASSTRPRATRERARSTALRTPATNAARSPLPVLADVG